MDLSPRPSREASHVGIHADTIIWHTSDAMCFEYPVIVVKIAIVEGVENIVGGNRVSKREATRATTAVWEVPNLREPRERTYLARRASITIAPRFCTFDVLCIEGL